MKLFALPGDFEFKHPTKRNLCTEDAIRSLTIKEGLGAWFLSLFRR
jgi:hypothetical protein